MKRFLSSLAIASALAAAAAAPASASFGFEDLGLTFSDAAGAPAAQAGVHPFAVTTRFQMNRIPDPDREVLPDGGTAKDVIVKLPPGLVGNPTAVPRCPDADFTEVSEWKSGCPDSSVVGYATVSVAAVTTVPGDFDTAVYNLTPGPGVPLKLGFVVTTVPVTLDVSISPDPPHNAIARAANIAQVGVFYGTELTLWGNPADPAHDPYRGSCLERDQESPGHPASGGNCPAGVPNRPLLTLPRSCSGPLETFFEADPWLDPGAWVAGKATTPTLEGCDGLEFEPTIGAEPSTKSAASPSGLDFDLEVDDKGLTDPSGTAPSDIKKAVVTLPEGMTVNPSQAGGLGACSTEEYGRETLASEPGDGCPSTSKIGSVEVQTPLLEGETIKGSLYLARPYENPSGSLLAVYMVLRDPKLGIFVKRAGKVEPAAAGANAGQLTTTFDDLPELPFSHFHLNFYSGERSPLVTPSACGKYTTTALLTPWARPAETYTTSSTFEIISGPGGAPCPPSPLPFDPAFTAGSLDPAAGSYSPFDMRITRNDGDQDLTKLSSVLPPGLIGRLAGVAKCPDAAIEAARAKTGTEELAMPSCPGNSHLGTVLAGAGVGSALTYVNGDVYLAGPYRGAPLSVAVITPAAAGPFDLGNVVVREALDLDPATAEVQIDGASDPIPQILAGIPLKLRDLRIHIDRPDFMLNPTNCEPLAVKASLFGSSLDLSSPFDGTLASRAELYQAAGCGRLGFKPRLSLKLSGGTRRNTQPALRAVLRPRAGDANVARAAVTLPRSVFLEQAHIGTVCTRVQFAADACPKGSIYGRARAFTPLLDEPLEGPVYLRSSNNLLPDLVASLNGVVAMELDGRIDAVKGRIRTTFQSTPDAPVSKFVLRMYGGKKGLITNSQDLCKRTNRAKVSLRGQNGKSLGLRPVVKAECSRGKRGSGKRKPSRS
jgi:hypothetical protein